jgi:hypothetical protein
MRYKIYGSNEKFSKKKQNFLKPPLKKLKTFLKLEISIFIDKEGFFEYNIKNKK